MDCGTFRCACCKYSCKRCWAGIKLQQGWEGNITMLQVTTQSDKILAIKARHRVFGLFTAMFFSKSKNIVNFFIDDYETGTMGKVTEMETKLHEFPDKDDEFPNKLWKEFILFLNFDRNSNYALPESWK